MLSYVNDDAGMDLKMFECIHGFWGGFFYFFFIIFYFIFIFYFFYFLFFLCIPSKQDMARCIYMKIYMIFIH